MRPDPPEALNDMPRDVAVASSGRFEARMREIKKLRDKSENELKNLREKSDTSSKDLTDSDLQLDGPFQMCGRQHS